MYRAQGTGFSEELRGKSKSDFRWCDDAIGEVRSQEIMKNYELQQQPEPFWTTLNNFEQPWTSTDKAYLVSTLNFEQPWTTLPPETLLHQDFPRVYPLPVGQPHHVDPFREVAYQDGLGGGKGPAESALTTQIE